MSHKTPETFQTIFSLKLLNFRDNSLWWRGVIVMFLLLSHFVNENYSSNAFQLVLLTMLANIFSESFDLKKSSM